MNAFVFSSPAQALKFTACPRALATSSVHCGSSAKADNDATASTNEQNHNAVRPRVMSLRTPSWQFGFENGNSFFRTPAPPCLFEHGTQDLLVKTIATDAEVLIDLSR